MSVLDMDELLIELNEIIELVYSPLVDHKTIPEDIDITLVEGAISSTDDLEKINKLRANSAMIVSLGDCAVTGNVPSMRNHFNVKDVLHRSYEENVDENPCIPMLQIPQLLPQSKPVHEYVKVDYFIPGCPPSAAAIHHVLVELLNGNKPEVTEVTQFGA